ncbi:hypothetical protein [Moorena sp. SIO4E2]|uniref:hypothetical protein n=1 Tax=Moorena sp. SIO4E2 TaxID=2607826 RepID=UPI00257CB095|nr:hypothetical protein [Moorena sp. SIO4E2]
MQRGLGGFPHERLHQDSEFGVTRCKNQHPLPNSTVPNLIQPFLVTWPAPDVSRQPTPGHPTPSKVFKAVCHPVRLQSQSRRL